MNLWGFLVGLIVGILPIMYLLRIRRIRFVENPFIRGAILGAGLWLLIYALMFIETRFLFLGIFDGEQGFASMMILSSSLQGFLTAGILSAYLLKKFKKL